MGLEAPSGATLQWLLAEASIAAFAVVYIKTSLRNWRNLPSTDPSEGYPDDKQFRAGISTLSKDSTAAEAFADRAKSLHASYLDSMKALDDKASTILSFVGGGSGLIALAAGSDKLARPAVTPLLVLAAVYLFCVLGCCVAVLLPTPTRFDQRRTAV